MIISAVIFISGALGFELIGGFWYELRGDENIIYAILTTCEESLEMFGVQVFIYALMFYIALELKNLTFKITGNIK